MAKSVFLGATSKLDNVELNGLTDLQTGIICDICA